MITFDEFLNETKLTTDFKYYHGCSKTELGEKILQDGFLKPGNENITRGTKLTPEIGKTYATPNLREAIIYTIGGIMMGYEDKWLKEENKYGYLFEIDKKSFSDVNPDEDYLGELIWIINKGQDYFKDYHFEDSFVKKLNDSIFYEWSKYDRREFIGICEYYLTPLQYKKCIQYNDYADFAVAGKKLNKFISNYLKEKIIKLGTPVANNGNLKFKSVWKFDKNNDIKLKIDGSNFFKLAEKIR
jgi:hypothetical protein